jgi:hypothetical protein
MLDDHDTRPLISKEPNELPNPQHMPLVLGSRGAQEPTSLRLMLNQIDKLSYFLVLLNLGYPLAESLKRQATI